MNYMEASRPPYIIGSIITTEVGCKELVYFLHLLTKRAVSDIVRSTLKP